MPNPLRGGAREALTAITADPHLGPSALDDPHLTAALLADLLPDAPRETSLILAAVSAGVPSVLRSAVASGMDASTSLALAAARLADQTAYGEDACHWAAAEIGAALWITAPAPGKPSPPREPHQHAGTMTMTGPAFPAMADAPSPPHRSRQRTAVIGTAVAVTALAVGAAALAWSGSPGGPGAAVALPRIIAGTFNGTRPAMIGTSAGRASVDRVTDITWQAWGKASASGTGAYWQYGIRRGQAELLLTDPRQGLFTRLRLSASAGDKTFTWPANWLSSASISARTPHPKPPTAPVFGAACNLDELSGIWGQYAPGILACVTEMQARSPSAPLTSYVVCTTPETSCATGSMTAEPSRILTSADGSGYLSISKWTGWGTYAAVGSGYLNLNDCSPNCADGTYYHYPASVTATSLLPSGTGRMIYTAIVVDAQSAPHGAFAVRNMVP